MNIYKINLWLIKNSNTGFELMYIDKFEYSNVIDNSLNTDSEMSSNDFDLDQFVNEQKL